jgi:hypothetical protein
MFYQKKNDKEKKTAVQGWKLTTIYTRDSMEGEKGDFFSIVKSGLTTILRCKQKILQCYNNLSNIRHHHLQQVQFPYVVCMFFFLSLIFFYSRMY